MVMDPAGSVCNCLLPTGNPIDNLIIPDFGRLDLSIVDAANPLVFIRAKDVGLTGKELPQNIDEKEELLLLLERIRGEAAKLLGFVKNAKDSAWESPGVPKLTLLASSDTYTATTGEEIPCKNIDIMARMMSMQKTHPTYAMTGAMCTAAAAAIPGTLVYELKYKEASTRRFRIGHPGGVLEAGVDYEMINDKIKIQSVYGYRTARLLLKGMAHC
jgi:2-methylaconitate cis-trans-isomerase PrpF